MPTPHAYPDLAWQVIIATKSVKIILHGFSNMFTILKVSLFALNECSMFIEFDIISS